MSIKQISMNQNYNCEFCKRSFKQKQGLQRHYEKCQEKLYNQNIENLKKHSDNKIENLIYDYELKLTNLTNENNNLIQKFNIDETNMKNFYELQIKDIKNSYEVRIAKLESIIEISEKRYNDLKDQLDKRSNSVDELAKKAIENTGNKTTNTINNNRNQIYNALQPLTNEHMRDQVQYLTDQNIKNGTHGIAHFASTHTFKDRVICTDKSRLNFVFKNENDIIIKDPEGVEITNRFIEINREELLRLLNEYLKVIENELYEDIGAPEYKYWTEKREEILTIRSAITKGNGLNNKENYSEFKKGFLSALSDLVPR